MMAVAFITAVSCDKEKEPILEVDYPGYDILSTGGIAAFSIKSNVEWTISNTDSWITELKPTAGKDDWWVTAVFGPNTELQERSSTFTVTGGGLTKTVVIKEKGADESLKIEYTRMSVPAEGGTAVFEVKSNLDWKVTNTDSWITAITPAESKGDGAVAVTFAPNTELQARGSTFTVTGGELTKTVAIWQSGVEESLAVEYTPVDIPAAGGTATFGIKANVDWTVSSMNAWVTKIEPESGTGDAVVMVTIDVNNTVDARTAIVTVKGGSLTESIDISQLAGELPAAAGEITESDTTPTSVVLNIEEINGAENYKWYKDGMVVQYDENRTYTATEEGTYKVAGVNGVGEGAASPDHVVIFSTPPTLADYLGDYVFNVTFVDPKNISSTTPGQYNDTMIESPEDGIDIRFSNAIDQHNHKNIKQDVYIDFIYDESSGRISYSDKYMYKLQGYNWVRMFVPFIFVGSDIVFVTEMEIELNTNTGELAFPTELTHPDHGTSKAYYTNWLWNADTKASKGRLSTYHMTDVVATKTGGTPAPAKPLSAGDGVVKIPVKIVFPEGINPNVPVKADQVFIPE